MQMPFQSLGPGRSSRSASAVAQGITASRMIGGGGLSVKCEGTEGIDGLCMCNTRLGEPCTDMVSQCRARGASTVDCAFSPDGHMRCYCDF